MNGYLFSIASLLLYVFIPQQIRNHPNQQHFATSMADHAAVIDPQYDFRALPVLLERYGISVLASSDLDRLQRVLPISNAFQRLGSEKAAYLCSTHLYALLNVDRPRLRVFLAALFLVGFVCMTWGILASTCTILAS